MSKTKFQTSSKLSHLAVSSMSINSNSMFPIAQAKKPWSYLFFFFLIFTLDPSLFLLPTFSLSANPISSIFMIHLESDQVSLSTVLASRDARLWGEGENTWQLSCSATLSSPLLLLNPSVALVWMWSLPRRTFPQIPSKFSWFSPHSQIYRAACFQRIWSPISAGIWASRPLVGNTQQKSGIIWAFSTIWTGSRVVE